MLKELWNLLSILGTLAAFVGGIVLIVYVCIKVTSYLDGLYAAKYSCLDTRWVVLEDTPVTGIHFGSCGELRYSRPCGEDERGTLTRVKDVKPYWDIALATDGVSHIVREEKEYQLLDEPNNAYRGWVRYVPARADRYGWLYEPHTRTTLYLSEEDYNRVNNRKVA